MKNKSTLMALMTFAMGSSLAHSGPRQFEHDLTPVKKVIPKGCKEYKFPGFTTIARTEDKARKKYENWKKNEM